MGWKRSGARAIALGVALLVIGVASAGAYNASELLQQDLIVTRVQRGVFPNVRLWVLPAASESLRIGQEEEAPRVIEVVPDYVRAANGAVTNLKHPRNIRNIGAYYLEPGDKIFCARATYQPKTKRWLLDGIQRIVDQPAPKLARGNRKYPQDPLEVEMITDKKSYRLGEPVRMTLRARNRTQKPIELVFPNGETHEVSIYGGFREVWRLKTLELVASLETKKIKLKPGETIEFVTVWDQKTTEGEPAEPGRYFAAGKVVSEGRAILPDSRAPFRIKADAEQANGAEGGNQPADRQ